MNLTEAIEQLNKVAFTDDKTPLENALALNKEVALIDAGKASLMLSFSAISTNSNYLTPTIRTKPAISLSEK